MNGNLLSDDVVIAYCEAAELCIGTEIKNLRLASDDTAREKMIAFTDSNVFFNNDVGFEDGPFADSSAGADKTVGADYDAVL